MVQTQSLIPTPGASWPPSIHMQPSIHPPVSLSLSQLPQLGFVLARPCNKQATTPGSPAASFESDRLPARPPIHPSAAPKHEVPARHDPTRPTALQPAALTSHPRTPVHRLLRRRSRFVLAAPRKANEGWEKRCRAAETFGSCQGSMDTRLSARLSRGLDSRRPGTVMQVSRGVPRRGLDSPGGNCDADAVTRGKRCTGL